MKNLHLLSELHLFHLFCYMRNLPFLIAFSFALIYQRNSVAFTIGIHLFVQKKIGSLGLSNKLYYLFISITSTNLI